MNALIYQAGNSHNLSLDISFYGICVEIVGSKDEIKKIWWDLFKSKFKLPNNFFDCIFWSVGLFVALRDMVSCVFSLGKKGGFPFKDLRDIRKIWKQDGRFIIPFGNWMYIAYGLRNAASYCKEILNIPEQNISIEGSSVKDYMHRRFLGPWICRHTKCGGIAFFVAKLDTDQSDNKSIPWNVERVWPNGNKPELKDGPCFSCGEMLNGDKNLTFERCQCNHHKEPDSVL